MINFHLNDTVIKSLTSNELNILRYIYKNPEEIADLSVHEFAVKVCYSTATVMRFCKKLGYSGFAEFKYSLRRHMGEQTKTASGGEKYSLDISRIVDSLSYNTEGTARLIQEEQLYQTFRYLDSACALYLWAPGGVTSILTDYFEKLLFSIGRQKVYKIDSPRIGEHILRDLHTEALLILISTTGDFPPTAKLARLARMNNIPVLSITPYANNTIAEFGTINFRFFTNQRENRGAEFTSRLPVFFVIQFIIHAYLLYRQDHSSLARAYPASLGNPGTLSLSFLENAHSLAFTDTEKEILKYFESHLPSCAFLGLKDLESRLYTSGATIVRFCQKLGFKGFNELKYQIRLQLENQQNPQYSANSLISHSIAIFKDNLEAIDIPSLCDIVDFLTSDRPVYIYGNELSSVAAKYLHMILTTLDYPSILLEWPRLLDGLTYEMSSDAILFVITAHGDAPRYLPAFQKTQQRGICSVLLTCEADSPLLATCTYGLYTNDQNEEYHHVDVNSRLGILTVVQILIELIVHKKMGEKAACKYRSQQ
ncbi:MAG: MurR/RpiR family transcriptional regulator [Lachnospiraceae bacterium]|jgi:DNA-binding MurR/RpiR family transcriptional regulator|nr:MurR/RpiR family transcriptional regulator [Lachnospiraceae bacterium]